MSILDEIRRDMEAGTPGPWVEKDGWIERAHEYNCDPVCMIEDGGITNVLKETQHDARRIARVPQLEAIALAAGDAETALSEAVAQINYLHEKFAQTGSGTAVIARAMFALAALRKAMEAAK